ncbi:MAG: ABC transporter substrate-binding protein [Thermodesulfovibrio sp.]|nr:ABC transporter substrate-binding protein [Thermodesulfovibrio sp.]
MYPLATLRLPLCCMIICCLCLIGFSSDVLAGETIRINGSGIGLDMMKPLIAAYSKAHPGISIEMEKPLGSSGAIKALIAGALDIAVSSKPLKAEEAEQGATLRPFGRTPLAIVVGGSVPVKDITTPELEKIYSGTTVVWPGGETIRLILRPQEDIDTKILRGLSPGMDEAVTRARKRPGMITVVTDPESNQAVARTIGSIGASGLVGVLVSKPSLSIISLNGIMPSAKTLADGRYPLAKEIYFVTTSRLSRASEKFIDFIYSDKGRAIVEKIGVLVTAGGKTGR